MAAAEDQTSVLINCLNTGAVTGAVARTGAVYQITSDLNDLHSGVGGIAGYVQNAELTDNVNRGNVVNNNRIFLGEYEAVLYSGGIAALAVDSQVDNNVNLANVTSSSASDAFQVAAGVVGISQGATISDNLNMGNVTSPHVTAGAVAYGFGTEPNYVYHLAMQNGVLNKDLDHEDCLLITSAKLLLDYPIVEELIPASSWSTVLFIDPNSDEILYTQVLLNGDCIDETLLWNNVTFRSFVAWLDEDGEEYDDFTKPIYADCLVLKALVINHSYTTTKDFVSMVETAKNSRIWVLTFKTTNVYSDGAIEVINCSIELNGNNANLDGKYKFGAGHYLAGYTLVYDIKGNGSNIKNLSLIFE